MVQKKNNIRSLWVRIKSGVMVVGAIFTMLGLFFGAFQYIDTTYASDTEVTFLSHKIDVKILDDRIKSLQTRLWDLMDRKLSYIDEQSKRMIDRQIRETESEKDRLDSELKITISKYKESEENLGK